MQRVLSPIILYLLFTLALAVALTGCAGLGPKTEGTAGPIRWYVRDLDQRGPRDPYGFTLVVVARDIGLQITRIDWAVHQPGVRPAFGIVACSDMAMVQYPGLRITNCGDSWKGWRLAVNDELRVPLSIGFICGVGGCSSALIPLWQVTLTGTDDLGKPVREVIDIALPGR